MPDAAAFDAWKAANPLVRAGGPASPDGRTTLTIDLKRALGWEGPTFRIKPARDPKDFSGGDGYIHRLKPKATFARASMTWPARVFKKPIGDPESIEPFWSPDGRWIAWLVHAWETDSDGLANAGKYWAPEDLARYARETYEAGISVSAVGFGLDFSEKMMRGIADAGGGSYYFVEKPEALVAATCRRGRMPTAERSSRSRSTLRRPSRRTEEHPLDHGRRGRPSRRDARGADRLVAKAPRFGGHRADLLGGATIIALRTPEYLLGHLDRVADRSLRMLTGLPRRRRGI